VGGDALGLFGTAGQLLGSQAPLLFHQGVASIAARNRRPLHSSSCFGHETRLGNVQNGSRNTFRAKNEQ
jgi:hypothetical protein